MTNERIEKLLNKMVDAGVFPGATYALITRDHKYIGKVGNKSVIPTIEENSIDTLYDVASLSKVIVTTTIITRMLYKKMINLRDKVVKYLPEFKYPDITIFDLLTHTSGLPASFNYSNNKSKEELLESIFNLKLKYKTDEKVVYSDIGFILLGLIIENVYKKPLDEVAKIEVFDELKMSDSCYNPQDKQRCAPTEFTTDRGLIRGEVHDGKAQILNGVSGHAGVFCSINDIINFCEMIKNDGYVDGKLYLPLKYIDLWFMPFKKVDDTSFRSIGWIVRKYKDIEDLNSFDTLLHTGFTGTTIMINRNIGAYCILLSNRVHPEREQRKTPNKYDKFYTECCDIARSEHKDLQLRKIQ